MLQLLSIFVLKKAMFNLNEDNSIVMAQHPSDMRIGINGMCGQVRKVGLDPTNSLNTGAEENQHCVSSERTTLVFLCA